MPAGHSDGSAVLSIQEYPVGHAVHCVAPVIEEYVPSGHVRHVLALVAPTVLEYVPAGHLVLAVPALQ